jgi:hypothetical protein
VAEHRRKYRRDGGQAVQACIGLIRPHGVSFVDGNDHRSRPAGEPLQALDSGCPCRHRVATAHRDLLTDFMINGPWWQLVHRRLAGNNRQCRDSPGQRVSAGEREGRAGRPADDRSRHDVKVIEEFAQIICLVEQAAAWPGSDSPYPGRSGSISRTSMARVVPAPDSIDTIRERRGQQHPVPARRTPLGPGEAAAVRDHHRAFAVRIA